jgi:hypothetical protein
MNYTNTTATSTSKTVTFRGTIVLCKLSLWSLNVMDTRVFFKNYELHLMLCETEAQKFLLRIIKNYEKICKNIFLCSKG